MSFKEKINELEFNDNKDLYTIEKGKIPILFTAVHTHKHIREDGTIKLNEPYTKSIALYLNKYFNTYCMVKNKDDGTDSNKEDNDKFKTILKRFIKENNIKLVIDLHGASEKRDFDIEFGTLDNISIDYSIVKELENSFINNGINNIIYNDPFKGGKLTQSLYDIVDVIQIEINAKYRDYNNIDNLEKIVNSFITFINKYNKKIR